MLTVLFLLFSCYTAISTLDVKPFVSTAIDDFLTQKEAGSSDVFSVLIEDYVIDGSEIIGVTILPKDSRWKFLLSNEDSLGTSFVSISYIERDGKLFYWDTDDSCLTQEIYEVLLKYDFIERRNVPRTCSLICLPTLAYLTLCHSSLPISRVILSPFLFKTAI